MICQEDLKWLKENIREKMGEKIIIKGSYGRNKPYEKEATVENVYNDYFRIKFDNNNSGDTHRYVEVFTGDIEIHVNNGEGFEPMELPLDSKLLSKKNRYLQV